MANEFIDGELGWSSFEAREAKSKISFIMRIRLMNDYRWPKIIVNMIDMLNLKTDVIKREHELRQKFDCSSVEVEETVPGYPNFRKFKQSISEKIKAFQDEE